MGKIKKLMPLALCMLGIIGNNAMAAASNNGVANGSVLVKATVPQMCTIADGTFLNFDMGEFINVEKSTLVQYNFKCKQNAIISFAIELGSNPNSTAALRRLPLNGEQGDVKNYLNYSINSVSAAGTPVGDTTSPFTKKIISSNGTETVNFYAVLKEAQNNASVGSYSDTLQATIEYH